METLVPVESTREEASARRRSKQRAWFRQTWALVKALVVRSIGVLIVVLVPLVCEVTIDNGIPVEITYPADEVASDRLRELP